jgi:pectate lyase
MRLLMIFVFCLISAPAFAAQKAFPTADGYAQFAEGGRGGVVYLVTNVNDSGPGSLRECVQASGRRQCIIVTDGDICLKTELIIQNPFISIIGQTAPGQGVQLRQCTNSRNGIVISASEVIIRHIKCRLGPTVIKSGIPDCLSIGNVTPHPSNIIIDHGSFSWTTDQLMETNPDVDRVTVQDSFFYEGLNKSTHTTGGSHSKGPNIRHCSLSMVRNLIANNLIRNPNNTCGLTNPNVQRLKSAGIFGENEFRNNVVFNGVDGFFDYYNGRGESEVNIVGNVFLRGPSTRVNNQSPYAIDARDFNSKYFDYGLTPATGFVPAGTTDKQSLCLQGNISEGFPGDAGAATASRPAEIQGVLDPRDAHIVTSTDCINNPVGNPQFGAPRGVTGPVLAVGQLAPRVGTAYAKITNSAVLDTVLGKSGAIWWDRDTADARIATQVAARQGKIIDHPSQVGGWPVLRAGTRPTDTDSDGMPDDWEILHGLSPGDSADRNGDSDFDGYTNLEEYTFEAAREQVGMGDPSL